MAGLIETGANDVLQVTAADGRGTPAFVESVVLAVEKKPESSGGVGQ